MNINDQLFIAAQVGDVNLAINLLALRPDVDAVHKVGVTALYIASQNGHVGIVELLLKNGADPEIKFSNGMTPLINAAFNGKSDVVQMLIDYGADIEAKIGSATVLHIAAQNGQTNIVELLLDAGAHIEYATAGGHTPLYAAIHEGKIETVEYLIKAGASVTDNAHRFTPFYLASALGLNRNASPLQQQVHKIVKAAYDKELAEFHKKPEPEAFKKTEYVFARFNEPIDRIKEELPKDNDLVYIYNKGEELTNFPAHWRVINVENKGLDPQAYLKHIVDNYDNFIIRGIERVALFQGMPDDHPAYFPLKLYATNITSNCDNTIGKCEKTTIQAELDNMEHTIKTEGWKTFDGGKYANVVIRDYSLERYINELICPFPHNKEFTINWGNQFAVDVDVIMRHPKEYYQRILDRMDIQFPAEVHFFERTNDLMFELCPYNQINIDYAGDVGL